MKYIFVVIVLAILIMGCVPKEIPSEEVSEPQVEGPLPQPTDEEILANYNDDLDEALAELDLLD